MGNIFTKAQVTSSKMENNCQRHFLFPRTFLIHALLRKWCQELCSILLDATSAFGKMGEGGQLILMNALVVEMLSLKVLPLAKELEQLVTAMQEYFSFCSWDPSEHYRPT